MGLYGRKAGLRLRSGWVGVSEALCQRCRPRVTRTDVHVGDGCRRIASACAHPFQTGYTITSETLTLQYPRFSAQHPGHPGSRLLDESSRRGRTKPRTKPRVKGPSGTGHQIPRPLSRISPSPAFRCGGREMRVGDRIECLSCFLEPLGPFDPSTPSGSARLVMFTLWDLKASRVRTSVPCGARWQSTSQ